MSERTSDREEWYNRNPKVPEQDASKSIKISAKAKGELSTGFSKVAMPAPLAQGHAQTKSERDSVGSRFTPGPGNQHKGKASPASEADCVKVKPNHEYHAK